MLTLIHGDNIVASRNELVRLKESAKDKEIRDINGKNISESDLRQAVESSSLFGNTMLVIIEQLFSGLGKKEKQIKLFADILNTSSLSVDIILWESKEMGKTVLTSIPKAKVQLYKMPIILFEFLDGLKPNTAKQSILSMEKMKDTVPSELLLYMIETRIRHLIQVKDGVTPDKQSPWQTMRLTNQAKSFTMDKLLSLHTKILKSEYAYKTGRTPFSLSELISQILLTI